MNGHQLMAWRKRFKISRRVATEQLGISEYWLKKYELREPNREIPRYHMLAVAAYTMGVRDYNGSELVLLRPQAEVGKLSKGRPRAASPKPSVPSAQEAARAAALDPTRSGTSGSPQSSSPDDAEAE